MRLDTASCVSSTAARQVSPQYIRIRRRQRKLTTAATEPRPQKGYPLNGWIRPTAIGHSW
jgi:hypothetical protein